MQKSETTVKSSPKITCTGSEHFPSKEWNDYSFKLQIYKINISIHYKSDGEK